MNVRVGTSGWSYKEWKGSFYPAGLPSKEMLHFYSSRFSTVEVNNSFYRTPAERVLTSWADQVPAQFRFVLKASRRITHNHRLTDEDGSLGYFLRAVNPLGSRLGPTLFQLPPTFQKDLKRLHAFLDKLPRRWPAVIEFRHRSWLDDEVHDLLQARGVALAAVDEDESDGSGWPLIPTAEWGYLRLRRTSYEEGKLQEWAYRIREQRWNEAYVFLKHEDGSPVGPAAAGLMEEILTRAPQT